MTELNVVKESATLPPSVVHVPGAPIPAPAVVMKAVIGGVEHHWFVYRDAEETDEDVARRVARTQRHITLLREKFGGEAVASAPNAPPAPAAAPSVHADDQLHDCPWHGQMQWSSKMPGTQFCRHKMADGTWCKEKWPKKAGEKSA